MLKNSKFHKGLYHFFIPLFQKSKQNVFSTDNESIVPLIYIIILDMLSREIYKVLEVPIPMNVCLD